jgi:predicted GTPase
MEIVIRYFEGCPNVGKAEERVLAALAGRDVPVTRQLIETQAEAEVLGFRGSPTVLIDGTDPWDDGSAPVGMACRLYPTPDGLDGAPSLEELKRSVVEHGG